MAQPALIVPPSDRHANFFAGTINPAGGELWFFNNSTPLGRAETVEFAKVFPELNSEHIFNGLLLLPTVQTYELPVNNPRFATTVRSGIHLPQRVWRDCDWKLGKAQGIYPFVNDSSEFTTDVKWKMFDRKCIFRCIDRRTLDREDEVEPALEAIRAAALDSPNVRIWCAHGLTVYVLEVTFEQREYPPPPVRVEPPVVVHDNGEDTRKPARRRKKVEED